MNVDKDSKFRLVCRPLPITSRWRCVLLPEAPPEVIDGDEVGLLPPWGSVATLPAPLAERAEYCFYDGAEGIEPDSRFILRTGEKLTVFSGLAAAILSEAGANERLRQRAFLLTLLEALHWTGTLEQFARSDRQGLRLAACASHLLFEATAVPPSGAQQVGWELPGGASFSTPLTVVVGEPGPSSPAALRVLPAQGEDGIALTLRLGGAEPLREAKDVTDWSLLRAEVLAYRELDPEPVWGGTFAPVRTRKPGGGGGSKAGEWLGFFPFHPMAPAERVGQRLRYRVEVKDVYGGVRYGGEAVVLRERLDAPLAPSGAVARLVVGKDGPLRVDVAATLAGLDREDPSNLTLEVYAEHRPLDETGFFGDDDDRALEDLLVEADLDGDDGRVVGVPVDPANLDGAPLPKVEAVTVPTGEVYPLETAGREGPRAQALRARLVAAHERKGRLRICDKGVAGLVKDAGPDSPVADGLVEIRFSIEGEDLVKVLPPSADRGARLLLGVRRRVTAPGVVCASVLTPCHHKVENGGDGADARSADAFQLERFSLDVPRGRRLLRAPKGLAEGWFEVAEATDALESLVAVAAARPPDPDATRVVRVRWAHPSPGQGGGATTGGGAGPFRIGGYRLWMRDLVGANDDGPFRPQAVVQVVDPRVAQYRPLRLEGGGDWERAKPRAEEAKTTFCPSAPGESLGATLEKVLEAADSVLCATSLVRPRLPEDLVGTRVPGAGQPLAPAPSAASDLRLLAGSGESQGSRAAFGHLMLALRDAGAVLDRILRLHAFEDGLEARLKSVVEQDAFESVKLLWPHTGDGHPGARLRLMAVPPQTWCDERKVERDLMAFLTGPRLVKLYDVSRAPAFRTLDPQRRVTVCCGGVAGPWHHDQEWMVECLDRYAPVRSLLDGGDPTSLLLPADWTLGDVKSLEKAGGASVRHPLSLDRTQPVTDRAQPVPVPGTPPTTVFFEVLESPERLLASAHALARTRAGRLRVVTENEVRFPLAGRFRKEDFDPPHGDKSWSAQVKEAIDGEGLWAWKGAEGAPQGSKWDPEVVEVPSHVQAQPDGWTSRVPSPFSDGIELKHAAYYFRHVLHAWVAADGQCGPRATAEEERLPARLAMLRRPRFRVTQEDKVTWKCTVWILPTLLGTHLDDMEADTERVVGADRVPRMGEDANRLPSLSHFHDEEVSMQTPIHLLPDPELRYGFKLNRVARRVGERDPARGFGDPVLVPLFEWGWAEGGKGRFRFNLTPQPGTASVSTANASAEGAAWKLEVKVNPPSTEDLKALAVAADEGVAGAPALSDALYVSLGRGRLATLPVPLVPLRGQP